MKAVLLFTEREFVYFKYADKVNVTLGAVIVLRVKVSTFHANKVAYKPTLLVLKLVHYSLRCVAVSSIPKSKLLPRPYCSESNCSLGFLFK